MARPRKNNAEYFSHDNDMRNDKKILAVRNKYGYEGYAIYCMMLETLCGSDFFKLKIDDKNLFLTSGDFRIDNKKLKEIIDFFVSVDLFQKTENNEIICRGLINRLQYLLDKREEERVKYSKVKESKVKKSKRNSQKPPSNSQKLSETHISDTETKRFKKPTVAEIKAYCSERSNSVDADKFFNHYESNGWRVGKNPMKDWKASVRTWERNSFDNNKPKGENGNDFGKLKY